MERVAITLFVITIALSVPQIIFSQGFLRTEGTEIVNEQGEPYILKGMGLGGWMLQEGYMLQTASFANPQYKIRNKIEELIGKEDTDAFYNAWLDNHVQKADIDSLKSWGFNSVRLPMHYKLFTLPIEDEPIAGQQTWLEKGFELTDNLISWCRDNDMYVILDLHGAPGGQGRDEGISDYDPSKPSLWESQANQDKTVALWQRLAERYVDEPVIGGYDLLNEVNWDIPGNDALKDLYLRITDAIRSVDNNHIIFIEGNWFANDFTNLTPPWDDNLVYSPHKYWSVNDKASIQWVLDIRSRHNVPLYFGEWGENSNTWFRDVIQLYDEYNIGWAVWPMKKIESIAGPLSIKKSAGYQRLLDFWTGGGSRPSAAEAKDILMQLTEDLKIGNCTFQKDVIDAMFSQINSTETRSFNTFSIPGVVYASDFDLGPAGAAYFDNGLANYQVTTGNFTAWNNGWTYRNDGVDIEKSTDNINSNGYNVGWTEEGEWMQYSIDVQSDGIYEVNVRVATEGSGGSFHLATDQFDISKRTSVANTGGWQNWQSVVVKDVVLETKDQKLRFYIDNKEFNLSSFQFVKTGEISDIATSFISANTLDPNTIVVYINKSLNDDISISGSNIEVFVNGNQIGVNEVVYQGQKSRSFLVTIDQNLQARDNVRISYNGNNVVSNDGVQLSTFNRELVQNNLDALHAVPGKIEAEEYIEHSGIQLENTTDTDGGQNIGYLDAGDYADYEVNVAETGIYNVDYRTAALSETGQIELQLIGEDDSAVTLHQVDFPSTGGWQNWTTTSKEVALNAGKQRLRILITEPLFNINWFEFNVTTSIEDELYLSNFNLYPNPGNGIFYFEGTLEESQDVEVKVYDINGTVHHQKQIKQAKNISESMDVQDLPTGHYFLGIVSDNGKKFFQKFVIFD